VQALTRDCFSVQALTRDCFSVQALQFVVTCSCDRC